MTTLTNVPSAIEPTELAELIGQLPEFPRKFTKTQRAGDREFSVSGPKADAVAAYIMRGGYTRAEIAEYVGCSQSRVAEVAWGMIAAGLFDEAGFKALVPRTRKVKDEATTGAPETNEFADAIEVPAKRSRKTVAA
jgi:hypothetical protein